MSNLANYDRNTQIEIVALTIKRKTVELDITPLLEQFIIYEDLFQVSLTARLIFRDQINLVGSLPITGGESIVLKFRTPIYSNIITQEFVVYKIGERGINNSSENIQINQLFLCTPEAWWASTNDISAYHKGTYSQISQRLISETGSKKKFVDAEESVGIVNYAVPAVNTFQAIKFGTNRSNTQTASPMFFWESVHGFHIKSLKEIYRTAQSKNLYIEDRMNFGADRDAEKVFNTVYNYEYSESNNRLAQYTANAFGSEDFMVDLTNARILKNTTSYEDFFNKFDIKLNKYPLNNDNIPVKDNIAFLPYRPDMSHTNAPNRRAALAFMDNLKLIVNIPGDSEFKVGDIVWLQIPAKVGLEIGIEQHSSGKWLARSIKHLITKTTYSMTCELTKDSFDKDIING